MDEFERATAGLPPVVRNAVLRNMPTGPYKRDFVTFVRFLRRHTSDQLVDLHSIGPVHAETLRAWLDALPVDAWTDHAEMVAGSA